jgi:torulene dioxygenase
VGIFESEPYFAFHSVNAWEEKSGLDPSAVDTMLEAAVYENLDILKRFYDENMKATATSSLAYVGENRSCARAHLMRWKLAGVTNTTKTLSTSAKLAERVFMLPLEDSMELPTINPLFATKPSRYVYGCSDRGEVNIPRWPCQARHPSPHDKALERPRSFPR